MAAGSGHGLSPLQLYPLPAVRPDGPLLRLAARVARRWATAFPGRRARRLRAEGEEVARRVAGLDPDARAAGLDVGARAAWLALLRDTRRGLRQDPRDPAVHRDALALAGASWGAVAVGADGNLEGESLPTGRDYAAALGVMRGQLVAVGGEPEQEKVALLAAMALALWGGGVHVVARDGEAAAALAARLERACSALGVSVGLVAAGSGPGPRQDAWRADISCVPLAELVTDALRDLRQLADRPGDLRLRLERLHGRNARATELLQRGLRFAVLVDADQPLLNEALRTVALSVDDGASQELQALALAWDVSALVDVESEAIHSQGRIALTDAGQARLAEMLAQRGGPWSAPLWREQRVELALLVRHVLEPGVHYTADQPRIEPIEPALSERVPDAFERRLVLDLLAIREQRDVPRSGTPVASMSVMECLLRYVQLGGTLAAADRIATRELRELYGLAVVPLAQRPAPVVAEAPPPLSPEDRALMAAARAEHRQVAARLHKLLAFAGVR
jgi:hypothetical protein